MCLIQFVQRHKVDPKKREVCKSLIWNKVWFRGLEMSCEQNQENVQESTQKLYESFKRNQPSERVVSHCNYTADVNNPRPNICYCYRAAAAKVKSTMKTFLTKYASMLLIWFVKYVSGNSYWGLGVFFFPSATLKNTSGVVEAVFRRVWKGKCHFYWQCYLWTFKHRTFESQPEASSDF